jgi:hypothetical protein
LRFISDGTSPAIWRPIIAPGGAQPSSIAAAAEVDHIAVRCLDDSLRQRPDFWGTEPPIPPTGSFDIERILAQVRAVSLPQPASLIPKWAGTLATDSAVAEAKRGLAANKAQCNGDQLPV